MAVDGVLLEGQGGQLGQELLGQPGADHEPEGDRRHGQDQDLVQFVADPLGRDDGQTAMVRPHRLDQLGIGFELQLGQEAGGPQHAQWIVGEGDLGVEGRPQPVVGQVGQPSERVDQFELGQAEGHGVDREVTAGQVGLDAVAEGHLRLARVGTVHLGPVGGDLVATPLAEAGDGAEPLPLGPYRLRPLPEECLDLVGPGVGGEVEVGHVVTVWRRAADDGVADRAPDQVEGVPGCAETVRQVGRGLHQWPQSVGEHAAEGSAAGVGCRPTWIGNEAAPAPAATASATPGRSGAGPPRPPGVGPRPPGTGPATSSPPWSPAPWSRWSRPPASSPGGRPARPRPRHRCRRRQATSPCSPRRPGSPPGRCSTSTSGPPPRGSTRPTSAWPWPSTPASPASRASTSRWPPVRPARRSPRPRRRWP